MVAQECGDRFLKEFLHIPGSDRPVSMMRLAFNDESTVSAMSETRYIDFAGRHLLEGNADANFDILPTVAPSNQGRQRFKPQRSQVGHEWMILEAVKGSRDVLNICELVFVAVGDIWNLTEKSGHLSHQLECGVSKDILQVDHHQTRASGGVMSFLRKPGGGNHPKQRPSSMRYPFHSRQPCPVALDIEHVTVRAEHV